jgi:hypothetical protein
MKYTLVFSIYAVETYDSIKDQTQSRWGDKVTVAFEERTVKVLAGIQSSPLMYQAVANNENIHKGFIHANCSVFYEVKENNIEILFFWDNRQDPIFI